MEIPLKGIMGQTDARVQAGKEHWDLAPQTSAFGGKADIIQGKADIVPL
jgi:hypothetical protein